jgi:hypothetical protein
LITIHQEKEVYADVFLEQIFKKGYSEAKRFHPIVVLTVFVFALVVGSGFGLAEDAPSAQEQLLRQSMSIGTKPDERGLESAAPIKAYIQSGHVSRKPVRADYVDYRKFKKPAFLFGQKIVVIEEEYFDVFIGCCVNHGIGVTVEVTGDDSDLRAFAASNKCQVNGIFDPKDALDLAGVSAVAGKTYMRISCRENDLI